MTLSLDDINKEVAKLDKESKAFKKQIYKLAWFMRGALSVEQAFNIDLADIEIIDLIVKENLETTKETKLPFF